MPVHSPCAGSPASSAPSSSPTPSTMPEKEALLAPARYAESLHPTALTDHSLSLAVWSGYFRKSIRERQDQLGLVFPHFDAEAFLHGGLTCNVADVMVENCIGTIGLPLGVAPTFFINGVHYVVPMAVEEPSVIAAASGAAKLVAGSGGFVAASTANVMTGQIQVLDVDDLEAAADTIRTNRQVLLDEASRYCVSMKKRGGGVIDVYSRVVRPRRRVSSSCFEGALVVHIDINVCQAMGANVVNTVVEGLAPTVARLVNGRAGLKVLSNLCLQRRTKSSFRIPVDRLSWKGMPGRVVAERIVEAYEFADADSFRAATHNKGIMNGVDAVAIACGQDWRAIEAAAHAYASRRGYYAPLSHYEIDRDEQLGTDVLVGHLELPLSVGVKGGALQTHPAYKSTLSLLGSPSSCELGQVIISVGLAQNFAALRALAIEGIQKGHMALHARNIAVAAGVCNDLVPEVAAYMTSRRAVSQDVAKEYLEAHSLYQNIYPRMKKVRRIPSTFYVELNVNGMEEPLALNVALPSLTPTPVHIVFSSKSAPHPLQSKLLGEDKGVQWLTDVYSTLDRIKLHSREPPRANIFLQNKLKVVSIMLNIIADRLMQTHPAETSSLLTASLRTQDRRELFHSLPAKDHVLAVGFPLLLTLWQIFDYTVDQWVLNSHPNLARALQHQQRRIIECIHSRRSSKMGSTSAVCDEDLIDGFMKAHAPRWQATGILLCDALSICPTSLTAERLSFLHVLGEFFEYEATFAHDMARSERDAKANFPNVYVSWLEARSLQMNDESFSRFWKVVDAICRSKRYRVLAAEESNAFFDGKLFMRTSNFIRQYYGVPQESMEDSPPDSDESDGGDAGSAVTPD